MSPLGFDRDLNVIAKDDTAELYAAITTIDTDEPIDEDSLLSVTFTIRKPDETESSQAGEIVRDGLGFTRYTDTDLVGEYKVVAYFIIDTGERRSVRSDFEVIDPFNPPTPTDEEVVSQSVWRLLEDCFDSEEGGPWLQDVTMATFKKEKMASFISEGIFDINQQNPPTDIGLSSFVIDAVPTSDFPLLAQGVLLAVIRHLMRSYAEQPLPTGAQIVYEDRRDYLERWRQIYDLETEKYMRFLALWKRRMLGLGQSSILVHSKAGRLTPTPQRSRWIGRGYY